MSDINILLLIITIFVLAIFVGTEVISKVPTVLHTPLMSGTNAIHGIVLMAAMLVAGISLGAQGPALMIITFLAVVLGTLNVVGGFVVTDRMLEMFKPKQAPTKDTKK
jgi:NAD(P) transhydrogenase subunit alpha